MAVRISLRAARVNANLTIMEAAKKMDIGKDRLLKWEANPELVNGLYQKKFSEVYGLPVDIIFFGI